MARFLAHLALLIVALVYGGNYLVAKGLMPNLIGPSGFIVLRVLGGGGLFWLVRAVIRYQRGTWERIDRSDVWRLFACGTTGVAANQLLFFNGLNVTSPVNASLIMTINPVLVLLISAAMLGTKITGRKMLGNSHWRRRSGSTFNPWRAANQRSRFMARRPHDIDQCYELRILPRFG